MYLWYEILLDKKIFGVIVMVTLLNIVIFETLTYKFSKSLRSKANLTVPSCSGDHWGTRNDENVNINQKKSFYHGQCFPFESKSINYFLMNLTHKTTIYNHEL